MREQKAEIKPSVDFKLSQAAEELTGWETIAIEKRYGNLDKLGVGQFTIGLVWAFENRTKKTSWAEIEGRSIRELTGYFEPEDDTVEDDDEESPKSSKQDAEPNGVQGSFR